MFIDGPYGAGKSTIIDKLRKNDSRPGVLFLDEEFVKQELPVIQSFTTGIHWATSMVMRVLEAVRAEDTRVVIVDSSPYSAVVYRAGLLSTRDIDAMMFELHPHADIEAFILIPRKTRHWQQVWKRSQDLMMQGSWEYGVRVNKLNELSKEHFNHVRSLYKGPIYGENHHMLCSYYATSRQLRTRTSAFIREWAQ